VILHADHLGSTSLVTNASGGVVGQQRYHPYGTGRPTDTALPTDYRFTGQRREGTIGLYDYGARFYDPLLGRFLSADTVVPQPGNPQALNRYSYVLNRPLAGGDPTGHQGPVPGVGTLPWQSGLSLPPISPDAVRALSVAGPYVAPVVIAGGTVVVAGGGSYYVTMWAIQDNGPDYTVPLEFDPGTVNATYTPPGFSTLTAPTMVQPILLEGGYLGPHGGNPPGAPLPGQQKLSQSFQASPRKLMPDLTPPDKGPKWKKVAFLTALIAAGGTGIFYASQCAETCTQKPGPGLVVVTPTPTPPKPVPWQTWNPGGIPVEAW